MSVHEQFYKQILLNEYILNNFTFVILLAVVRFKKTRMSAYMKAYNTLMPF